MAKVSKRKWKHNGIEKEAWVVRYKIGDKHASRQFSKKKDADVFCLKIQNEEAQGGVLGRSRDSTVENICEAFICHQEGRHKDGRISFGRLYAIKHALGKNIMPNIGKSQFADVTLTMVEDLYKDLCNGGLSPRTARDRLLVFGQVERFAAKRGMARGGVVSEAMAELRGIPKSVIRTFSEDEVRVLLAAVENKPARKQYRAFDLLRIMVHLAAFCGLRYGEITGLRRGSLDLEKGVLRVRNSLTHWGEMKGPKTRAGIRDVPMPGHVLTMCHDWLEHHYIENDDLIVFSSATGTGLASSNFHRNLWQPLVERAGLWTKGEDRPHFHALRHFCASWMISNGLPITEVAALLGHQTFDMTLQTYAHTITKGTTDHRHVDGMALHLTSATQMAAK